MDDIKILDAVERYIRGEMNPDERLYFELTSWLWSIPCSCSK
jgi:alkylhydroperoxidase family enzyme